MGTTQSSQPSRERSPLRKSVLNAECDRMQYSCWICILHPFNRCCLVCRDAASSFFACADWQLRSSGDCLLYVSMSAASSRRVVWCTKCGATHFGSDAAQLKSG